MLISAPVAVSVNARFVGRFGAATAEAESPVTMISPITAIAATNALRMGLLRPLGI